MNKVQETAWGKNIITPRMKRQLAYSKIKSKGKALGNTLNKNVKLMGGHIKKHVTNQSRLMHEDQLKNGGFYNFHQSKENRVKKDNRSIKYYKRKGKKFIPVYSKHKKKHHRTSSNNPLNPFNLDF